MEKAGKPSRASARLRERLLATTSSSLDLPQELPNAYEDQAGTGQRKRRREREEGAPLPFEKARPEKRTRTGVSDQSLPLTRDNLRKYTLMSSTTDKGGRSRSRGNKRTASARNDNASMASTGTGDQETASQLTQKSSYTAAHYRLSTLAGANILFQFRPAPEEIGTQIAAIVEREVTPERKKELSRIGQRLHDSFASVLSGAAREDDCVELFHEALSAMAPSDSVLLPRKAGIEPL